MRALYLLLLLALLQGLNADQAKRAYDFQNTIGINIHLHYTGTCYDAAWDTVHSAYDSSFIDINLLSFIGLQPRESSISGMASLIPPGSRI